MLKRHLIPAQGDPENRTGGAGVRERLNADRDAERRGPDGATDHRVFEGKRRNGIYRRGPGIDLRMDGAITGRPAGYGMASGAEPGPACPPRGTSAQNSTCGDKTSFAGRAVRL